MKIITKILTILILTGCSLNQKRVNKQTKIDVDLVNYIYIKKALYGTDSILLSQEQTELFIKKWNAAESKGLYKMGPRFYLTIKLKNDSIRRFTTNGELITQVSQ